MSRYLYLNLSANQIIQQLNRDPYLRVITANYPAARTLKVPHDSLENLAEQYLTEAGLHIAPVLQASRLLRTAVSRVIPNSPIEPASSTFQNSLKAILRAGINTDELQVNSSFRTQQLALIVQSYTRLLREQLIFDPAELFWQASHIVKERQVLFIYGYLNPRIDQLNFINTVAGDGSVIVMTDNDSSNFADIKTSINWLRQQGWEVIESKSSLNPISYFLLPTPHLEAEVRGVLAQVKNLLSQGTAANEIVLIARDDAFYGPTVLDVAHEYNLPVRALYGVPLNETRFGAWIQLLLEVIPEKFPFENTAKLLSHPLCSRLSNAIWQSARKQHPANLLEWQSLGVNLSFLDWNYEDSRENWVEKIQVVLNQFKIRQGAGLWAREIVAYYKFQDALVELAKPEDEVISLNEFAKDITAILTLLTVPAQPGRGGVELHTPLSLFGAKYEHVFVLGAVEGILPAPVQDDPMLDFYERKQLRQRGFNLEDAAQTARREAISFDALLQIPKLSLTFSYPQMIKGNGTLPSPYLTELDLQYIDPATIPIASIEEARKIYLRRDILPECKVLPHAIHAWQVEKSREGNLDYDEYDGVINLPIDASQRVFSASQLTALGQCPFKWFAHQLLQLTELSEAEDELSALLRGNLYHRSLELALSGASDLTQILNNLEAAFLQAEQDTQLPVLSAWPARRAEHLQILNRACNQPDFYPSETQVLQLETDFTTEFYGLQIKGRIDRIDRTPEGLVLVDYKTSSQLPLGVKDESGKANIDIQMPLYMHVANTALFPGETVHDAYYYSVTKGKKLNKKKPTTEALPAVAEKIKTHLQQGYYPVSPDIDQNACRYCAYDLVCRKGERLSRKGMGNGE